MADINLIITLPLLVFSPTNTDIPALVGVFTNKYQYLRIKDIFST